MSAGVAACVAVPLVAAPAAADQVATASCSGQGVFGTFTGVFVSGTELKPLRVRVLDRASDGHHVAIRLVTRDGGGKRVNWSWHHYTSSGSTSGGEKIWDTTASSKSGIKSVAVQAARFEGSRYVDSCETSFQDNSYN